MTAECSRRFQQTRRVWKREVAKIEREERGRELRVLFLLFLCQYENELNKESPVSSWWYDGEWGCEGGGRDFLGCRT